MTVHRPFQNIVGLSYVLTGSAVAGMLGQIRTQLVDIIADLTAGTPLSELPNLPGDVEHPPRATRHALTQPFTPRSLKRETCTAQQ